VLVLRPCPSWASLDAGIAATINALLERFSVCVADALVRLGWTRRPRCRDALAYAVRRHHHDDGSGAGWRGFRLFLEPIIQNINLFATLTPSPDVSMLGISGGGWSTSMAAAIDPRIRLSIPVAGSAPL
jgi:hypothetical protein